MRSNMIALVLVAALGACSGEPREETSGRQAPEPTNSEPTPAPQPERMTDPVPADLREKAAVASDGMSWHFKPGWALFGPPESEGLLAFRCMDEGEGVIITRPPEQAPQIGASETLRFQSATGSATAQLTARDAELGPAMWEGAPSSPATLAALFDGREAPVVVTLVGERPLSLPADRKVAATIRECGARL